MLWREGILISRFDTLGLEIRCFGLGRLYPWLDPGHGPSATAAVVTNSHVTFGNEDYIQEVLREAPRSACVRANSTSSTRTFPSTQVSEPVVAVGSMSGLCRLRRAVAVTRTRRAVTAMKVQDGSDCTLGRLVT